MKIIKRSVGAGLVTLGLCFSPFGADTSYSITEVPACPEGPVGVGGLTDHGAIAGSCEYLGAFLSNREGVQFFAPAGAGELLYVRGLNRRQQFVGYSEGLETNRAILWSDGLALDLGALTPGGNASAYGINDRGDIVGAATAADGEWHPFLFADGKMEDLGTFGGRSAFAFAINNKREVAIEHQGEAATSLGIYARGEFRIVSAPTRSISGVAINESGHVAGLALAFGESSFHAIYYDGERMIDLRVPGAAVSDARSINDRDEIVGTWCPGAASCFGPGGQPNGGGFLYRQGAFTDIASLVPAGSGWSIVTAERINNRGQITGVGLHDGKRKIYLLSPRPATRDAGGR